MKATLTLALSLCAFGWIGFPSTARSDDGPKSKISGEPADLLGGYTIVAGEKFGYKEPTERIEGTTVRIADDAIVVLDKDKKEVYAQTYKIDTKSNPWKITLKSKITPKNQGSEEVEVKGLIKKEGDVVTIIYALPGGEMPTEFKTKEKQLLFVLKNERKK
jgi:uncharacterized protein (TIGR03067 family)